MARRPEAESIIKRIETLIVAVIILFAGATAKGVQTFQATLTGAQETPPNASLGTGRFVMVLNDAENTMFFRLSVSRLTSITGAHIHQGAPGVAGPIVFPLDETGLAGAPISGSFPVTAAQVADFQTGNFYMNVHTSAFPGGEIRGQIGTFTPSTNYTAILAGDQEIPPVTTNATGVGRFTLVSTTTLNYQLSAANISNINGAHIHKAPAGVAGPIIFPLFPTASNPTFDTNTPISGTVTLAPDQLVDLLTDFYYANIHTQANPGGEIRGQILKRTPLVFTANLDGRQETPPVGPICGEANADSGCSRGKMVLVLNSAMDTMFYRLEVPTNISNVTAQHIHQGAPGVAGPIVFPLAGTLSPGNPISGSFAVTATQVDQFVARGFYVNVHTTSNPNGEIRGQIGRFSPALRHSALLNSANEVPPITSTANGAIRFKLTSNADLEFIILVKNMSSTITAAHIHTGQPGVAGPVIVPLYNGGGTFDEAHPFSGTASLTPGQLVDFLAGNTYANVHTVNNPGGEVRGQLRPTVRGDANGDGFEGISVSDIFYLINFLFANGPLPDAGDSNGDEATTVADVFYLINFLFSGGAAPLD